MKKNDWIDVHDQVWWKIRCYQKTRKISDTELAKNMNVAVRTLKDYDADSRTLSLEKVNNFLYVHNLPLRDFLYLVI